MLSLSSVLVGLTSLTTLTSAACTRDLLVDTAAKWVYLQSSGDHGQFDNLSYNLTYLENNKTSSILSGQPAWPVNIAFNRSVYDTTLCKIFTELIVTDPTHPMVFATQLYLDEEGSVTKIDSLVTDKGDWAFNATGYMYWNSLENWDPIPPSKRLSRATLQAAADAYADRCNNVSVIVPFGTPCARLEGGAYTGRGNLTANTCNIGGLPEHVEMSNRRYVIDEEMGTVDIFLGFQGLDRTRPKEGTPDSHFFRIEDGKIRYIHTVSACWVDGCGMNGTGIPTPRRR
ncbi:uncharacterized protein BDR25DRAFT_381305 [Lindgomyces ingoldianus]|uniref:Uncharacterized protein n=1 Tax=Lindgomyces ingoldianus TaxID=673940 RepID=A0ACB6QBE0_9PLEO|nr:uncharacterized protein BDR25DRAFT_381305 [Lindgomyces ingoldianus]KAF2464216.1 hypothetical protein BDR25DRAFT_381305 [Lindgomyces ingoldianus]